MPPVVARLIGFGRSPCATDRQGEEPGLSCRLSIVPGRASDLDREPGTARIDASAVAATGSVDDGLASQTCRCPRHSHIGYQSMLAEGPSRQGNLLTRLRALGRQCEVGFAALPVFARLAITLVASMFLTFVSYTSTMLLKS